MQIAKLKDIRAAMQQTLLDIQHSVVASMDDGDAVAADEPNDAPEAADNGPGDASDAGRVLDTAPGSTGLRKQRKTTREPQIVHSSIDTDHNGAPGGMNQAQTLLDEIVTAQDEHDSGVARWQAKLGDVDQQCIEMDVEARSSLSILEHELTELHDTLHSLQSRRCA
jgi:hypothetical protein